MKDNYSNCLDRQLSAVRFGLFSGITRNVFVLGIVSFFTDTSTEMVYPLLPFFLTQVLKTGPVFVGLIEGIAESTASFFRIFSGWLSDKLAQRKILIVSGYTLSGLTRPLIAIAPAGKGYGYSG